MKKTLRINTTNFCAMDCCTCPSYCSAKNHSYLSFPAFEKIIEEYKKYKLDVVLEGGEPFAHKRIFLFLEYLSTICNLKKVIIRTNGSFLPELGDYLVWTTKRLALPLELKIKITSELLEKAQSHMKICKAYYEISKTIPNFKVSFEVFYTNEEDFNNLLSVIDSYEIPRSHCDIDVFRAIGKLAETEYPKVPSADGIKCWHCFASDGTPFDQNLMARSEYEKSLSINGQVLLPVFDAVNHKAMWEEVFEFISSISYENKDDVCVRTRDVQKSFIERNLNAYTYGMLHDKIYSYAVYYATRFHPSEQEKHCPFVPSVPFDWCAENLVTEFFINEQAMMRTTEIERFYMNKNHCLEIAQKLANLPVKSDIKTTLDNHSCFC